MAIKIWRPNCWKPNPKKIQPSKRFLPAKKLNYLEGVKRHGAPTLLLAWLPIVGDALCVAAGWLRMNWILALAFMAAGRLARYIAGAALA